MSHWSGALARLGACQGKGSGGAWAATQRSRRAAWDNCVDPTWLFWACGKLGVDRKQIVLAACACARLAFPYVRAGEERPRIAIETTEAWTRGEATIEQVRKACASAVDAVDAASAVAVYAVDAAAVDAAVAAVDAAASVDASAVAAASAAAAVAAYAAVDAAAVDADRLKMKRECCNAIRQIIPMPELPLRKKRAV